MGYHDTGAIVAKGEFVVNSGCASPSFATKYKNDLVHFAVDPHGGMAGWNRLKIVKGDLVDHRHDLASEG